MLIEWAAMGIELLAVAVIVTAVIAVAVSRGTVRYVFQVGKPGAYEIYKHQLGRSLLLGLDLLVAGDLVKTVALEPTLINVAALALLVLVRTFLSWSLVIEMEGHWPWEAKARKSANDEAGQRGKDVT
ncbi:MAG: hypothetical protein JWR26_4884 [Pedosphaera sp.]|nr:hypothetical protein [Pedosphaera sp.]